VQVKNKLFNELIVGLKSIKHEISHQSISVLKWKDRDISLSTDQLLNTQIRPLVEAVSAYPILSEEDEDQLDYSRQDGYYWILDPLDGTVNFYRSIPISCISLALWQKQRPVLGMVVDLNRDEFFLAVVEKNDFSDHTGAWLNGEPIGVSSVKQRDRGVVVTGFPARGNFETASLMKSLSLFQNWQKVRLLGSAALSLAWVSCGRADAFIEEDIHIWDVAAGLALVKAAGGEIHIEKKDPKNRIIAVATNGVISTRELEK